MSKNPKSADAKDGKPKVEKNAAIPLKKIVAKSSEEETPDLKSAAMDLAEDELAAFKAERKREEKKDLLEEPSPEVLNAAKTVEKISLENFDWNEYSVKGFGEGYSHADRKALEDLYAGEVKTITEGELVKGIVVGINDRDIVLNIGGKSDALVPIAEFKDTQNLKIGDEVDVFIEERENAMGQLVVSRRKAKVMRGWEQVQSALEKDEIVHGFVKRRTKGGLIVDVFGIEAFLPGSQIDVKPIRDFDIYVNKNIEVKVIKINYANNNVVVSHKVLIEKDIEQQKAAILMNLEKGQVLEGVIKNMTNFGVFIDLGGVDGLLHITDISWGRIGHPEEVLKLDNVVKVVVLEFDEEKKRISLGMKQLTPHPWDTIEASLEVGTRVKGKVVNVADYGAFLEIKPGVEGLIHVSEMSWSQHLRNPQDFIKVGDEKEAVVLTFDKEEHKMLLGIKQLTADPWTRQDILSKYAVNTRHKGIVRNHTNFGLFIELEEGIDGLVHVSDLSWTRKVKHPSEFIKVGETLEVQVLELDTNNRRLALSHKHLEENPWDTFEDIFTIGSLQKGTIVSKTDKGAVVELSYGIEGFCSAKNLVKSDNSKAQNGETYEFKIIEFSKEDRRIGLSLKATWSAEEAKVGKAEESSPRKSTPKPKTAKQINQETEKSTLGDIEALTALKEKLNADKNKKTE